MTEIEEYLTYLTHRGASERYPEYMSPEDVQEGLGLGPNDDPGLILGMRLEHELDVIIKSGFPQYFLIVADLLRFCRESGIPVGPGRGSVCGSAVAYSLYITDVEPIKAGIPFERFLHLERPSMPDIDSDICFRRRQEAIEYLRTKYGSDSVIQIIAFGTLMARGISKAVCQFIHVDSFIHGNHGTNVFGSKLSSLVPEGSGADQISLKDWLKLDDSEEYRKMVEGLKIPFKGREIDVLDTILRLEGLRKHSTVHAAGVIIGDRPIADLVPVCRKKKGDELQTQFDYHDAEDIGLLKMDVLGLRTVTIIGDLEQLTGVDSRSLPIDDKKTFELLQAGNTVGVFQLEGELITKAMMGIKPDRFDDIVATIALFRPGPMEQLASYIDRKHGKEKVIYPHPDVAKSLEKTYGLIVYQEQVMGLARTLADYTPGEADMFRKAIGKKLPELIAEQIKLFVTRATDRGYDRAMVEKLANQIAYFGRYGFNLGHATGYAYLTYWTAYFKANYPTEFFVACLNNNVEDAKRLSILTRDASFNNVKILGPHINASGRGFTVEGNDIRFGLEGIKGVGGAVVQDIIEERDSLEKNKYTMVREDKIKEDGTPYKANKRDISRVINKPAPYATFNDFCRRLSHVPINVKQNLILAGTFDHLGAWHEKDNSEINTDQALVNRAVMLADSKAINEAAKKGKDFIKSDTLEFPLPERDILKKEKEVLGIYVTRTILDTHKADIDRYGAVIGGDFEQLKGSFVIAGAVEVIKPHPSKRGEMAWVTLDTDIIDLPSITMFHDQWSKCKIEVGQVVIASVEKRWDKKYGWGLIGQSIVPIDRARPATKSILVSIPDTSPDDIMELNEMTDENGVKLYVLISDYGGRLALVRSTSYLPTIGRVIKDIESRGWQVRYDYQPNEPAPHGDKIYVRAPDSFGDRKRRAIWETPMAKYAADLLSGKVVAEFVEATDETD